MIGVLLHQGLLFADGGLMALGANIWNMAFYGCFVGGLIWRAFTRKGLNHAKIIAASLIGCILSLQLGAFSVSVETLASGITALPFGAFLLAMQPIHLAIGAVEGCITAAVLAFLYEARPSLLWQGGVAAGEKQRLTLRGHAGRAGGRGRGRRRRAFAAGICLPRWVGMVAAAFDRQHRTGNHRPRAGVFARIQEWTALLPDYNFAGSDAAAGTSAAGIIGAVVVLAVVILGVKLVKKAVHRRGSSAQGH